MFLVTRALLSSCLAKRLMPVRQRVTALSLSFSEMITTLFSTSQAASVTERNMKKKKRRKREEKVEKKENFLQKKNDFPEEKEKKPFYFWFFPWRVLKMHTANSYVYNRITE